VAEIGDFTARINEISTGFKGSMILFAANDAGVFALLEEERSADELAAVAGWHPRAARMLLDALVALDLIGKSEGRYRNTPIASACLVPGGKAYQGHIIKHQQNGWDAWARLEVSLRSGTAVERDAHERSPEELRAFILGMRDTARISARTMCDVVDLSTHRHMLDLGAGPATYAIVFTQRHPELRATVFDVPEVIPIAREQVAAAGLDERFAYIEGDMLADDLGSDYDLVLASNIIHMYGPVENRALMKRCYDALAPSGLLIVKDFLVDDGRSGPAFGLLFALQMLIHTPCGDTYATSELSEWTNEAGFAEGRLIELTPQARLWLAGKPPARSAG